ncbi:unnamed protein product [Sphagnum balticum]
MNVYLQKQQHPGHESGLIAKVADIKGDERSTVCAAWQRGGTRVYRVHRYGQLRCTRAVTPSRRTARFKRGATTVVSKAAHPGGRWMNARRRRSSNCNVTGSASITLHSEYLADQQKIRQELLTQFKDELDSTRTELEAKYRETLKQELARITDKHRRELSAAKKKQWVGRVCARAHSHLAPTVLAMRVGGNLSLLLEHGLLQCRVPAGLCPPPVPIRTPHSGALADTPQILSSQKAEQRLTLAPPNQHIHTLTHNREMICKLNRQISNADKYNNIHTFYADVSRELSSVVRMDRCSFDVSVPPLSLRTCLFR